MRHYTLTIILAIAFATAAYTQIDVPVDPLTGKAQIAFPLWQLKNNSVTVPITLTYNGGGLRVTESEGNAGMGWNISAGGQISREVRGLPDDLEDLADSRRGWLTGPAAQQIQAFNPSANLNSISCADELSDFNTLSTFYDNQNGSTIDTEPDVFTFSAPGVSGQFVFDQNKVVRLIPYQDIKIDYTRDATKKIASFTITTNNGVKYVFDLPLSTTRIAIDGSLDFPEFFTREYRMYSYKLMFNYTWMLKKIIDPTNQSIDFTYGTPQSTKWTKDVQIIRPPGAVISTMYSIVEEPTVVPIASIRDMTYLVNIGWTPYGVIGGISVAGPNMAGSKSFNFFYDRIRNEDDLPEVAADGNPHSIKTPTQTVNGAEEELKEPQYRSFLREFRETGSDCTPFPAYRFTYYDVNFSNKTTHLPFKYKFARDLWDYFNDKPDQVSSLVPRLYQKLSAQGNKRLRIAPHPGDAGYVATSGTDRSVNSSTVHYGSLRTVSYPSGGLAEITYEPADYYDSLANATFLGGGVRVKTVRIDDGDTDHSNDITTFYEYKRGDGQSSGKLLYPPIFGFYAIDNSNANYLLGALRSPINLAPDQGLVYSRVTQKQAGRGKSIFEYSVPGTFQETQVRDWKASYSRIARIMQDQTDEICDIVDPPPYEEFYDQTYEVCEPQDPETPRIPPPCQWVTTRIYYTVDPPPYETNCRSITTGSFCLSPGLFQNDFYSYPFAPSTNFDFERGLLQRVIRYDEANKEVSRKSFTYQRLPATPQTIKALRVEFGAGTNAPYRYYSVYELLTNASKVVSVETTTTYDNLTATTSISASSSYQYDPAHFLTRSITSLNSKGETRKVRFKYARDFASVPSPTGAAGLAIKSLNDSSRHGEVIETINSIIKGSNETVLSADITIYKNFASVGGAVLPSEKWIYSGGSGFQEAYFNGSNIFSFNGYRAAQYMDEYDSKGGLLTSHDRQGNFQTVLYSAASSLPRAFVKNARWDEVLVNPISDVVERIDAPDLLDGEQGFTTTITNPYSGEFSLSLLNAGTIRTTPVNKAPNSRYYRFTTRLRRNAAGNLTVNVMESSTLRSSTIANYSSASVGQWKYMEVLLDVGAVTGPSFTLDVQVPESTDFDYFALYPQRAELSSQVVHPLFGKLSETNARGLTAFTEYDRAGRVKYLKDQDKNIVQLNEYQYKVQPVSVSAAFYVSAFSLGRQVDFTAFGNCATSGLSYQWYVNDVAIAGATLSVFSYVFTADFPRVKLEVSHAVFGSASSEITLKQSIYYPPSSYIPPPTCTKTISISVQGDSVMRSCEDGGNPSRALRAFVSATDCSGPAEVFWEYLFPASMNSFVPYPSSGGLDFLFQFYRPALFDPIRSTPDSPVQTQVGFGAIPQNVYIRARVLMGNLQWAESNVISLQVINEGFCD